MRILTCTFVFAALAAQTASAASLAISESACLQRQLDLKKAEDVVALTAIEMAQVSLDQIPKAQLGGKIGDSRKKAEAGIKEMREVLREVCDTLFP